MLTTISATPVAGVFFLWSTLLGPGSAAPVLDRRLLVTIVAVLFAVFLLAKLRPRLGQALRRADSRGSRSSRQSRTDELDPAAALAEADASGGATRRRALALWVRAMRAAPHSPEPIDRAVDAFGGRYHRGLERALWERLEQLPWDASHRAALAASATGLARLYARKRPARSVAMEKLATQFRSRSITRPEGSR